MSQQLVVREAEDSDLPEVARIHVAAWKVAYRGIISDDILDRLQPEHRIPLWKEWSKVPDVHLYLAESEGQIVGFLRRCPARPIADPPDRFSEFTHVYLDPAKVGTGVGRHLFQHGLQAVRQEGYDGLLLWVLERNARARSFYEAFGLRPDGARMDQPEHLGHGVFEVRLTLPL